ncbi:type I-B CRISPR-associated protein Cas7/Cst2/DevR [Methanohalophilus euhalobius]|jgi:CRISPR-associated protein Cst2|uniref:CRISPR-associated Cst2 family autoregulator n=1 Tax=Methanohalophilus euhalobius TaxID=51203 RepID=A0A314ZWA2_9EURY|nr:type I-B CRISPR-associated protein Cas7/Cst2/DevR [Methanohalophilus euhalobius]PQV42763.1 CRISPR-associated Cst2 family autoregulator [Methanohalophilus euhalobius]RNI10552.1 type I-B CRISPR-associated protein Cas7/Cst2/DevR [Methanohalophilus euhalobius]
MKTVIGTYLIDAPFSALNNKGIDSRGGNENEVSTKSIYSPEGVRPYVSGQALRYWWRNVLEEKYGWNCSPVEVVGKNQAVTNGNPLEYDDDDMFGYMSARKEEVPGKKKLENVTVTRVSPLKCSPLIGYPIRPTSDFGVLTRKTESDPILFAHQFYSNILKGIFSIDLDSVGKYTMINKSGSKNLSPALAEEYDSKGLKSGENVYEAPLEIKKKRVTDTLKAINYLNGGAMQALHHTDVTPKLIILAALNGGNNIFMNIMPHKNYQNGLVNIDALYEVLDDYKDDLLTKVYIGILSGFETDKDKEIFHFKPPEGVQVEITTPVKAVEMFNSELETNVIKGE